MPDNQTLERSRYEEAVPDDEAMEMAGQFQEMLKSPAWASFKELLVASKLTAREQALEGDPGLFLYWKGYVAGLAEAGHIPGFIISYIEGKMKRQEVPEQRTARVLPFSNLGSHAGQLSFDGDDNQEEPVG